MAKLVWDKAGERFFEAGVRKGVLYAGRTVAADGTVSYGKGVAWNGLTAVTESPSGAEPNDLWADNIKYATLRSTETLGGTIEAYTYPDEWKECDGSKEVVTGVTAGQQGRSVFGLSYQTLMGSDADPGMSKYKIHLVYGATASPAERAYATVNDSPDAMTMSWEFETAPEVVVEEGVKPISILTIDPSALPEGKQAALEDLLYGTSTDEPTLPTPDEVFALIGT